MEKQVRNLSTANGIGGAVGQARQRQQCYGTMLPILAQLKKFPNSCRRNLLSRLWVRRERSISSRHCGRAWSRVPGFADCQFSVSQPRLCARWVSTTGLVLETDPRNCACVPEEYKSVRTVSSPALEMGQRCWQALCESLRAKLDPHGFLLYLACVYIASAVYSTLL
jgi:hypothetical protein